MISNTDRT